jgi:AraC-like DNA-binding protein
MRYVEYAPTPRLSRLVECYWFLEGHTTGAPDAIIPDGRVELILHYGGPFWRLGPGTARVKQPASLLVGQMMGPVVLAPEGHAGVAAIRLRPGAARTVLRFSLQEISGSFVDLESVFPSVSETRERLAEAASDGERLAVLEAWLGAMACPPPRPQVEAAVVSILQSAGRASIDTLAASAELGIRQLERQFQEDVGLAPKTFSRIVRLQAALRRIREGRPLSDVALACGYYDQAHMTRDFRQLAAMSPGAWQAHPGDLAPLFVTPASPAPAPAFASHSAS